jgi:pyridoxal phosphate enzyme (YggS family)
LNRGSSISGNLRAVNARIEQAARNAGRSPAEVMLLAVSKTFGPEWIREAAQAGQHAFGENQAQEALTKMEALCDLALEWHFIGSIQSNKTRAIAENFAWVHSVDREKIGRRLSDARPPELPPLQVCIEVNVSGEETKSGVRPEVVPELARALASLPRISLRGLMSIPEDTEDFARQRSQFRELRQLKDDLAGRGFALDTLSMGMSHDLEAAVMEGATIVRVGTAIFGERRRRDS